LNVFVPVDVTDDRAVTIDTAAEKISKPLIGYTKWAES